MDLNQTFDHAVFVFKPSYWVAGIQCGIHYHPISEGTRPIAALYERWIDERLSERIPSQTSPPRVYGMTLDEIGTDEAIYRICVEVTSPEGMPEGVSIWQIPETEYALFDTRLDIVLSGTFWRHFYGTWLPQSGLSQPGAVIRDGMPRGSIREAFEVYAAIPCADDAPIQIMAPILRT